MQEKVIKRKEFDIKPFKQVMIGDPMYFEKMKTDKARYKKLVFMRKALPTGRRLAKAVLTLTELTSDVLGIPVSITQWRLQFISTRKGAGVREERDNLLSGKYDPYRLKERKDLVCDTAEFYLNIDGVGDVIHTGSDGKYGVSILYHNDNAAYFNLWFDAGLFSENDLLMYVRRFFEIIQEYEWEGEKS